MACRWVALGTAANSRVASVSQVPIAVPPSARNPATAALACARVVAFICTIAERPSCG